MMILALLWGIIVVLAVFGAGVFPWCLHFAALAASAGCLVLGRKAVHTPGIARCGLWAALLVVFLAVSAIPLPGFLDWIAGSLRAGHNAGVRSAIEDAGRLGLAGQPRLMWFALTRNMAGTLRMILLLVAGFCVAAMASRLDEKERWRVAGCMAVMGAVIAAIGFVGQWVIPQGKTIWWLFSVPHGRPVGCFVNRNHFGGFLAMLCPVAAALAARSIARRNWAGLIAWTICLGTMSFAVIMSLSRGAWVAFAAGMLATVAVFLWRRMIAAFAVALIIVAGIVAVVGYAGDDELVERAESMKTPLATASAEWRMETWISALGIVPDYPLAGAGANGLRAVFPAYRTASTTPQFRFAENEYVQLAAEGGLAGVLLVVLLVAGVVRTWRPAGDEEKADEHMLMGVAGAMVVAATHAFVDFALRMPLYFIVLCALAGLAMRRRESQPVESCPEPVPGMRWTRTALPAAAMALTLILCIPGKRLYLADSSDRLMNAGADELCRAMVWSPTSWQAWDGLGVKAARLNTDKGLEFAERCISKAAGYDPNNYRIWERLARLRLRIGDRAGARAAYLRVRMLRDWPHIKELDGPAVRGGGKG